MKRFRPSLRRVSSFAAAAFAGAAATLFIATPAFAHHPVIDGDYDCNPATGNWDVTWSVANSQSDFSAQITAFTLLPVGSPFLAGSEISVGATLPVATAPYDATELLTGSQTVPGTEDSAKLTVTAFWAKGEGVADDVTDTKYLTQEFEGECSKLITVESTCTELIIKIKHPLGPNEAGDNITGNLHPSVGTDVPVSVAPGEEKTYKFPASAGLTVTLTSGDFEQVFAWQQPRTCGTPTPSPTTPVTGASVTGTIGIGAGLVLGGAALIALVFMMRRRRTVAGH